MAQLTEGFDNFLLRVTRRAVSRLVVLEETETPASATDDGSTHDPLLAKIRMAARLRRALNEHIYDLIVHGQDRTEVLLAEDAHGDRPTWKEIGDALGISAQAAHHKYGEAVRSGGAASAGRQSGPPFRD